jgi:hypothetical protein
MSGQPILAILEDDVSVTSVIADIQERGGIATPLLSTGTMKIIGLDLQKVRAIRGIVAARPYP